MCATRELPPDPDTSENGGAPCTIVETLPTSTNASDETIRKEMQAQGSESTKRWRKEDFDLFLREYFGPPSASKTGLAAVQPLSQFQSLWQEMLKQTITNDPLYVIHKVGYSSILL